MDDTNNKNTIQEKGHIMPNWCTNKLTVKHADSAAISEFLEAYKTGVCEHYIPSPEFPKDEETLRHEKEANCLFAGEGEIEWKHQNWGTKWDFDGSDKSNKCEVKSDHEVRLEFYTAWAPPIQLFRQLYLLGFDVKASYYELGCDFCGRFVNYVEANYDLEEVAEDPNLIEALDLVAEFNEWREMMADCEDC